MTFWANMVTLGVHRGAFIQLTMLAPDEFGYFKFQYGGNKQRVAKAYTQTHGGSSTIWTTCFHGMNDYPLIERSSNSPERCYVYGPIGMIAVRDNSTTFYFIKDHLGSTRVIMGQDNVWLSAYDYTPMGDVQPIAENKQARYYFTGQELDIFGNGSVLHNFRARMYDSDLGRFYAMDPARQGFSPFAYAGNNPVIRVDRTGRWFIIPLFLGAVFADRQALAQGQHGWERIFTIFSGAAKSVAAAAVGYQFGAWAVGWTDAWSTAMQSISAGAIGGAASSGTSSLLNGGNVGRSVVSGFLTGGLGAAAGIGLHGMDIGGVGGSLANIAAGGVIGGAVNELMGGGFEEGFKSGAISSFVGQISGGLARYTERAKAIKEAFAKAHNLVLKDVKLWPKEYQLKLSQELQMAINEFNRDNKNDFALRGRVFNDTFDRGHTPMRIDDLHIRFEPTEGFPTGSFHFDHYGLMSNPVGHGFRDEMIDNWGWFPWLK